MLETEAVSGTIFVITGTLIRRGALLWEGLWLSFRATHLGAHSTLVAVFLSDAFDFRIKVPGHRAIRIGDAGSVLAANLVRVAIALGLGAIFRRLAGEEGVRSPGAVHAACAGFAFHRSQAGGDWVSLVFVLPAIIDNCASSDALTNAIGGTEFTVTAVRRRVAPSVALDSALAILANNLANAGGHHKIVSPFAAIFDIGTSSLGCAVSIGSTIFLHAIEVDRAFLVGGAL